MISMTMSWRVFRIAGIDIRIDSSWIILFSLITLSLAYYYFPVQYPHWQTGLVWTVSGLTSVLLFASVLAHELAHSLVARKQGESVRSITLFIFGGIAEITREPKTPARELAMALAGPVCSFVIGLFFLGLRYAAAGFSQPVMALCGYLSAINIVLGIFNLIPGFPLDGGRVLRSILWRLTDNLRLATRIASLTGQILAFILIFIGILEAIAGYLVNGIWLALVGWFLHNTAVRGYQQLLLKEILSKIRVKDIMSSDFAQVPGDITVREFMEHYILGQRQRTFLVVDHDDWEGIVSLHDAKAVPLEKRETMTVRESMTPKDRVLTVSPDEDGSDVLAKLAGKGIHQIPVIDKGEVKGVVRRGDILEFLHLHSELGT
jgi:Zn-dependent protease/CBS domain-containing protein